MKVVKVCPECKKYNNYKLYECKFCGANLGDDTVEVEDDAEELVYKEEPSTRVEPIEDEGKEEARTTSAKRVCPMCGYESSGRWCDNCGCILDTEEVVKEEKSDATVLIRQEINFSLFYKGKEVNFMAINTTKTLGRYDFNEIISDDLMNISRKHLEYVLKENELYLKDISTNGTTLNGMKMVPNKEYVVKNHDKINLAGFEMEIRF